MTSVVHETQHKILHKHSIGHVLTPGAVVHRQGTERPEASAVDSKQPGFVKVAACDAGSQIQASNVPLQQIHPLEV